MATNKKYQNISIQPQQIPRSAKTIFELPNENLIEDELVRKSTSDRTKRRVAHEAWFPLPVIRKPIAPVEVVAQEKPKKSHVQKKESVPSMKSGKVRTIKETVAVDSRALQKSTSSEVDDRVQDKKRKSKDLECEKVTKKKSKLTSQKRKT